MKNNLRKILKVQVNHLFLPVIAVLLILCFLFRGHGVIQFELVTAGVLFYIFTAFLHHHFDKSLTVEVILEYILIAFLVLVLTQGLLV